MKKKNPEIWRRVTIYKYSVEMREKSLSQQPSVSMDPPIPNQNPNSVSTVPAFNQSHADLIISSLLSFPDSSPISIGCTFDRVLDKALDSASGDVSDQDRLVDRTLELASLLLDSTKRCFRKRASVHNSNSWFLPPELTIKVTNREISEIWKLVFVLTLVNLEAMC